MDGAELGALPLPTELATDRFCSGDHHYLQLYTHQEPTGLQWIILDPWSHCCCWLTSVSLKHHQPHECGGGLVERREEGGAREIVRCDEQNACCACTEAAKGDCNS